MEIKKLRKDKKIILNLATILRKFFPDYRFNQSFSYSISSDKKEKTIKIKIKRNGK